MELQEQEQDKEEQHIGKLIRKSAQIKAASNSKLSAIQIISQRKTSGKERTPEACCTKK